MGAINLNANFKKDATNYFVNLSLFSFTEEGVQMIYSPALDLYGYGKTKEDAVESFQIAFEEFFRYTHNKKCYPKC